MSKLNILAVIALTFTATAQAAETTGRVKLFENIGSGAISFSGPVAQKLYNELQVQPTIVTSKITQKIGANLSCTEDRNATRKVYACGLIFISGTGQIEPEYISGPQPGISFGN